MKYFGTDGYRAIFDDNSIVVAYKIGFALADFKKNILISKDTRASGDDMLKAFVSGAIVKGASVTYAGIMPTPALAVAVKNGYFDSGAMITASHNPPEYNGIKLFDENGYKLSSDLLNKIENGFERVVFRSDAYLPPTVSFPLEDYLKYLDDVTKPVKRMKVLIDCASGATVVSAPKSFVDRGIETTVIGRDGLINVGSGVFYVDKAREIKMKTNCDLAFVFDGDGDRVICVDERNDILDGDKILYLIAKHLLTKGLLEKNTAVGTVYSSLALERALDKCGIGLVRTPVGDSFVAEKMRTNGYVLGAESSGHVIYDAPTGDGLKTALMLTTLASIEPLKERMSGYEDSEIKELTKPFDEKLYERLLSQKQYIEKELGENGRLLIRRSGTEPVIRILAESSSKFLIERAIERIEASD